MGSSDKDQESFAALFEQSGGGKSARKRYQPGDRVDVTVVAVGRDAVFADLGGKQEGVFSRASLCDDSGKLAVDVGAKISAMVTRFDDVKGQVELSPVYVRKASTSVTPDLEDLEDVVIPKAPATPLVVEGAVVRGKVTGVERYGVFVQIQGTQGRGGRGLVPASETATPRGSDLKKHFTVGQDLEAKIVAVEADGKIRMSISALAADAERRDMEQFKKSAKAEPARGVQGFGTLGDLLSKRR